MKTKSAYLKAMLKKVIILFDKNGFNLSEIKKDLNLHCLDIKQNWDGYHQLTQNNNFDLNKENNYRYYPNRNIHKIVIDSKIDNGIRATETLIHELCHAVQYDLYGEDCQPHGKEFKAIASKVGLNASKTYTPASMKLKAKIQEWEEEVGIYPNPILMSERIENFVCDLCGFLWLVFMMASAFIITQSIIEYFSI